MGERGGFLRYQREDPLHLSVEERIRNWNEFYIKQKEQETKVQAARCMECGTPFCHIGDLIGGAAAGCPLHNLIPEWNDLVYRGLWKEAYQRLAKTADFPEFTGRVCPALCEGSCTAGLNDLPVTVKNNEKELVEKAFSEGWVKAVRPEKRTGKKAAVIGSGPAGLACAKNLNKFGHSVTVFEKNDRPGGLLMYGIPNMKLDKEKVLQRRIRLLEEEGIEFVTGTDVGGDISPEELLDDFDAIVFCIGSTVPRDLDVPGRELEGVHFAVDYLSGCTRYVSSGKKTKEYVDTRDRDVVVIGGGDTGTDCVASAIRQGCRSVIQLEIMPRPSEFRMPDNPWPEWPRVLKVDYGQEEAIELYGSDPRIYQMMTKRINDDGNGKVGSISAAGVEWEKDDKGRYHPVEIENTLEEIKADVVFLAMGFLGPDETVDRFSLERNERNNIKTGPDTYMTATEGVFAAGDARRGQSLVVWAMYEGRDAAVEIDRYLNNI